MKTNGKTEPTRVNMFVVENVVESIQNNGSDLEKNIMHNSLSKTPHINYSKASVLSFISSV